MPAGFSPALAEAIAQRDRALRQAAERWADLPVHARARLLSTSLRRYACAAWRHEQHAETCPHPELSLKGCLWRALRARGGRLVSIRQLQRVLATTDDHLTCAKV